MGLFDDVPITAPPAVAPAAPETPIAATPELEPRAPMELPPVDLPKWPPLPEATEGAPAGPAAPAATPPASSSGLFDDIPPGKLPPGPGVTNGRIRITPNNAPEPYVDQGPKPEPVGGLKAAGVGLVNGATFNFADEVLGAMNAGLEGMSPAQKAATQSNWISALTVPQAMGAARLGWELLNGEDGPATQAYRQARNRWRDLTKQGESEQPGASLAGSVAGAVAAPGGAAAAPVRAGVGALRALGTRMARSSATAAVQGGLAGTGEGEDLGERATKGATGTVAGATVGALVPVAAEPIIRGAGAVLRGGRRAINSLINPASEAERVAGETVMDTQARIAGGGPAGRFTGNAALTPQQFADAEARGQPVANIDLGGRAAGRLARNAKNTPNADIAGDELGGLTETRFHSQGSRIAGLIYDLVYGGANGRRPIDFERLREIARGANGPAYRQAHADAAALMKANEAAGETRGIWSTELNRLTDSPTIKEAMLSIGKSEGDRSIIEGFNKARKNPFVVDEKGRLRLRERVDANGNVTSIAKADLNAWDSVQRLVRDLESSANVSGNLSQARRFGLLRQSLVDELDRLVPSYGAARGTAYRGFRAQDAYEAGENYVAMTVKGRDADELRRTIANMSQSDREVFMHGFTTRLMESVEKIGYDRDVLKAMFSNGPAMRRIEEALGATRTRELEAILHVERVMQRGNVAVNGNSTTAQQLLAAGAFGVGANTLFGNDPLSWSSVLAGVGAGGTRYAHKYGTARLADEIGRLLATNDPAAMRRGIALAARNGRIMENLRNWTGRNVSKGSAPQTTTVGASQTSNAARADDEPVPGPSK
jgi:hypothetical protein